jgi:4-hydroxy-tetrahydrodipicolinate reductase
MPIRVAVTGASGRMGGRVAHAAHATRGFAIAGAVDRPGSPVLGRDLGEAAGLGTLGITVENELAKILCRADVVVDFTVPEASVAHCRDAARAKVPIVIGTTGFGQSHMAAIRVLSRKVPVLLSPNMSVAMNVLFRLAYEAGRILGEEYDAEIVEIHHRTKMDAPSGTALRIGQEVARARGNDLRKVAVFHREGVTGERPRGAIGLQTLRGGDVVGDHTLVFAGTGERLELTHRAGSRDNFALGALRAAAWLVKQKKPGLYDISDVLGLR